LREKKWLRMFENRVLKKTFGPKRDEVAGEWRKIHNEELYDLYSPQNIIQVFKIDKNEMGWPRSVYEGDVCTGFW